VTPLDAAALTPETALRIFLEALQNGGGSAYLRSIYVAERDGSERVRIGEGGLSDVDYRAFWRNIVIAYGAMLDSGVLDKDRFLAEIRRQNWRHISSPNAVDIVVQGAEKVSDWQTPKGFFDNPSTCDLVAGFFYVVRRREMNCRWSPALIYAEHERLATLVKTYKESTRIPAVRNDGDGQPGQPTVAWPQHELVFGLKRVDGRWLVREWFSPIRKCFPGGKWQTKWYFAKGDSAPFPDDLDFGSCPYDPRPLNTPAGPRVMVYLKPPGNPSAYWGRHLGVDSWPAPELANYIVGYSSPLLSKHGHWVVFLAGNIEYISSERFLELYRERRARRGETLPADPFLWWGGR
jgi:hypothetical protein